MIRATELPTVPNPNSAMRRAGRSLDATAELSLSETEFFTYDDIQPSISKREFEMHR
jgi:hypothetical protein